MTEINNENINNNQLNKKIIGNAISAYLMIFISWLFLFNKNNKNINNNFVKGHTKSAMIIHLGFFITYIIFISNSLFASTSFIGIGLNEIIASILSFILLMFLILGIYNANKGKEFNLHKNINISKKESLIDIDGDGKITEKEKLSIILSYVPFIGFVNYGKFEKNDTITQNTRFNLVVSTIILFLYIFSHSNLANIFSLIYIIFICFVGINLFTRDELIIIKIGKYFSPNKFKILLSVFFIYIKNYFNDNKFKEFNVLLKEKFENELRIESETENELKTKKGLKQAKFLIYTPILNLIFIFFKNTKYSIHIINGITITFLLFIIIGLSFVIHINNYIYIMILFPILFGTGYAKYKLSYKMPFIYDLYKITSKIFSFLKFGTKKINQKRKEENVLNLKVK